MRRHIRFVFLLVAGLVLLAACGRQVEPPTVEHEVTVTIDGAGSVVSSPAGIDTAAGDVTAAFEAGTVVTLTAVPDSGYTFDGFSFDDAALECEDGSTATTCVLTVDDAIDVTATFSEVVVVPGVETLTVVVEGDGEGVVVSDPVGIDSDEGDLVAEFEEGEVVTLTATAVAGSEFVGFSFDDPGLECEEGSTVDSCIITLDASVEVTVTFARLTQELSVTVVGNGSVESSPAGIDTGPGTATAFFDPGVVVTLTATEGPFNTFGGFAFSDPARECEEGSTDGTCVITLDEDVAVTATFIAITDTITVAVNAVMGAEGNVTSSPSGIDTDAGDFSASFARGSEITLTATATEEGFAGWTGGACDGLRTATCTFVVGEGEPTITAGFNVITSLTVRISADQDDVEEFLEAAPGFGGRTFAQGYTYFISNDIEFAVDPDFAPQAVGLRFAGVAVPQGANVLEARLGFTAFENPSTGTDGLVELRVSAHATANAPAFETDALPAEDETSTAAFGVTSLVQTDANATWTITEEWTAEEEYESSDLAGIVQELVDQEAWFGTNAMAFIIEPVDPTSTEFRRAYTHTEEPMKAATLTVSWVVPPPPLP